jgi:hypothetical protein
MAPKTARPPGQKKIKVWVVKFSRKLKTGFLSASHKKPSEVCCMANNSGMAAKGIWVGDRTFFKEAIPIPVRTMPAPKLALAEKHMQNQIRIKNDVPIATGIKID